MISVTLYKDEGNLKGFKVSGHVGYAERGKDIVCAAVSALVINTVNSLEKFTDDETEVSVNEKDGTIELMFKDEPGHDAELLTKAMISGLREISESQGFIKINTKEV